MGSVIKEGFIFILLAAVVVFLFIALITSGVVLFSIQVGKLENYQEQAREYMSKGMYEQAYMTLLKEDEDKIKDTELYELVNDKYESVGVISKDEVVSLEKIDINKDTKYFKLKDFELL